MGNRDLAVDPLDPTTENPFIPETTIVQPFASGPAGGLTADAVTVADAGTYFTGTELEAVTQEIGAALDAIGGTPNAAAITIADAGGYFTGTEVEAATQELGAGLATKAPNYAPATTQSGTTYTVDADDHGTIVNCSNAALVTVTLPTNASVPLSVGYNVMLFAAGAAGVTLTTTSLTLLGSSPKKTIAQNQAIYCEKTATDTWVIIGGTAT